MITLTELKCLFDEWKMWTNIVVVYEDEYFEISMNKALAYYGDLKVDHFNSTRVWLRGEND